MNKKGILKELLLKESQDSMKILMPKENVYMRKGMTQRDYIKRSGVNLRTRGSPRIKVELHRKIKPKLQVVGYKEKITLTPRIQQKNVKVLNPLMYNNRPCSCSPNSFIKVSRETLTIKVPSRKQDSESDTESNVYLESKLKYDLD